MVCADEKVGSLRTEPGFWLSVGVLTKQILGQDQFAYRAKNYPIVKMLITMSGTKLSTNQIETIVVIYLECKKTHQHTQVGHGFFLSQSITRDDYYIHLDTDVTRPKPELYKDI